MVARGYDYRFTTSMQIYIPLNEFSPCDHSPSSLYNKSCIMKKILVPTDFSENAQDALSYALSYAIAMGKNTTIGMHIIHLVEPIVVQTGQATLIDARMTQELVDSAKMNMDILAKSTRKSIMFNKLTNCDLTTDVVVGNVASSISKKVIQLNADILIMGTKGNGHSKIEKVFGTVSSSLVNNSVCPVLFVPKGCVFKIFKQIIFATDLKLEDQFYLWKALKVISPFKPKVNYLHVMYSEKKLDDEYLNEISNYFVDTSPALHSSVKIINGYNPENFIEKHAVKIESDLILMTKKNKGAIERLWNPSRTKRVLDKLSDIPLMVLQQLSKRDAM